MEVDLGVAGGPLSGLLAGPIALVFQTIRDVLKIRLKTWMASLSPDYPLLLQLTEIPLLL